MTHVHQQATRSLWVIVAIWLTCTFSHGAGTEAWARGFSVGSTNKADYAIGGMNTGWEVPGSFDVGLELRNLGLAIQAAAPVNSCQTNIVEGWTVRVNERLLVESSAATERALELLRDQLKEIKAKVPAAAVKKLQHVTLWFSPQYPDFGPKAEYHPGAGWLRRHGRNEQMAKGVEFTNIPQFEAETRRMPNFTLHELAHAFHDQFLPGGFENPEIKAAHDRAKACGLYNDVERSNGDARPGTRERAYALNNPMEFFAELSEAFFSRNDFFPFDRQELRKLDPETESLLSKLWGEEK